MCICDAEEYGLPSMSVKTTPKFENRSIKAQCVSRVHRLNSVIKHGLGLKGVCVQVEVLGTRLIPSLVLPPHHLVCSQYSLGTRPSENRKEGLGDRLESKCTEWNVWNL